MAAFTGGSRCANQSTRSLGVYGGVNSVAAVAETRTNLLDAEPWHYGSWHPQSFRARIVGSEWRYEWSLGQRSFVDGDWWPRSVVEDRRNRDRAADDKRTTPAERGFESRPASIDRRRDVSRAGSATTQLLAPNSIRDRLRRCGNIARLFLVLLSGQGFCVRVISDLHARGAGFFPRALCFS